MKIYIQKYLAQKTQKTKIEYEQLLMHMKKEFAMENMLFITIMLQWQNYLIENKYWNEILKCGIKISFVCSSTKRIQLSKSIPFSPIIYKLTQQDKQLIKQQRQHHISSLLASVSLTSIFSSTKKIVPIANPGGSVNSNVNTKAVDFGGGVTPTPTSFAQSKSNLAIEHNVKLNNNCIDDSKLKQWPQTDGMCLEYVWEI